MTVSVKQQVKKNLKEQKKTAVKFSEKAVKPQSKTAVRSRKTTKSLKMKSLKAKGASNQEQVQELLDFIVKKLNENKAEEIVTLNLQGKTSLADYLVIASGTSARHLFGLANNLAAGLKKAGYAIRLSGEHGEGNWIVIDAIDIIIHLFLPQTRMFYDIEGLWKKS